MQQYQFYFQITQKYVSNALKIISPYWVEVTYEVVDNKVVVTDVKVPYMILTYLTGYHLANDIYYAAENNALSMGYFCLGKDVQFYPPKNDTDIIVKIFDHFKMPVS